MIYHKILNEKGGEIQSEIVLHPGDILVDELDARNITISEFAVLLTMKPGDLSGLLHGRQQVNADIAVRLEQLLNIDAEYWLRVQSAYDLYTIQNKRSF